MSEREMIRELLPGDPYRDSAPLPKGAWATQYLLLEIERRTGMSTEGPKKERAFWTRGPVVAAVGFALVIAAFAFFFANRGQDVPPAVSTSVVTETTVTQTTTPSVNAEERVAVATEWLSCLTAGCRDEVDQTLTTGDDIRLDDPKPLTVRPGWTDQWGVELIDITCEQLPPPVEGVEGRLACTRTSTDAASRAWDYEYVEVFGFAFEGNLIAIYNYDSEFPETSHAFLDWLVEEHATEFDAACPLDGPYDEVTCVGFLETAIPEFEASAAWVAPGDRFPSNETTAQVGVAEQWLSCLSPDCYPDIQDLESQPLSMPGSELPVSQMLADLSINRQQVEDVTCEPIDGGGALCTRRSSDVISPVWGFEYVETFRFFFEGDQITSFNYSMDHPETVDAFFGWLETSYGLEQETACDSRASDLSAEKVTCVSFIESHIREFEESDAWVPPTAG